MKPTLFEINVLGQMMPVAAYVFFGCLGFLAAWGLIGWQVWKEPNRRKLLAVTGILSLGMILGARLFYGFHNPSQFPNISSLFTFSTKGFAVYGGIMALGLLTPLLGRVFKLSMVHFWDLAVGPLALGLAIGRIGCFYAGCCFGKPTNVPWAVLFPWGSMAHRWQMVQAGSIFTSPVSVHPTQLYELAALMVIAGIVFYMNRKRVSPGIPTATAILFYSAFRLMDLFFRADPGGHLHFWVYPSLYGSVISVSAFWLVLNIWGKLKKEDAE